MSERSEWDVYRYVVDDPTLDRDAFEQQMLEDVSLAMSVAEAVAHIDLVKAAASTTATTTAVSALERERVNSHWPQWAALAATVLLTAGLTAYYAMRVGQSDSSEMAASHQIAIAEQWLALSESETSDGPMPTLDTSATDSTVQADQASEEDDWLIDAAREFYTDGATS